MADYAGARVSYFLRFGFIRSFEVLSTCSCDSLSLPDPPAFSLVLCFVFLFGGGGEMVVKSGCSPHLELLFR